MIDWGDGQRSEGIVTGAAGQFAVFGPQHMYSQPGTFETTVLVQSGYGTRQTLEIISSMSDGSDLPGTPAVSHEMRILWDDGTPDSIDAIDATFDMVAPAITRMRARHVYDTDTFLTGASTSVPLAPTGRIYGVDIPRDLDIADGGIDIPEGQMVIYGFEDQPLSDVPLVTFTKHEFGEQDVTTTAIWGDGTVGTMPVVVNADNTLSVQLDHTYMEEEFNTFALPLYVAQQGEAEVVVHDTGDLDPLDAFDSRPFYGPGWGLNLLDRLIVHANGDLLWVDGAGNSRKYARQADGSYENQSPTDFGSMAAYDDTTFTVQYTARDNTKYTFNHLGLLVTIDAPADGVMQLAYDPEGELISVSAADASTTTLTYAGFRLAAIQETGNRTFTPTYAGSLQTIHDVDGSVRNFAYDANNHLLIDTWGVLATGYSYAADTERLITVNWGLESDYSVRGNDTLSVPARVDPQIPALVPDADDATGLVTDPLGRIQEFTLDEQGRIEGLLGPDQDHLSGGQYFSWVRDLGHQTGECIPGPLRGNAQFFVQQQRFDHRRHAWWPNLHARPRTTPLQYTCTTGAEQTIGMSWNDTFQKVTQYTDELGHVTQIIRDGVTGLATQVIDSLSHSTYYQWENLRLTSMTDRRNIETTYQYDTHLRLTSTLDAYGQETQRTYDAAGNLVQETDQLDRPTDYTYDALNRRTEVLDRAGNLHTYGYDAVGNLIGEVDEEGRPSSYVYDLLNRRVVQTDPAGGVRHFAYDAVGNLTQQTDELDHPTTYVYDLLNRRVTRTDALETSRTYTYDAVGNLTQETDELLTARPLTSTICSTAK